MKSETLLRPIQEYSSALVSIALAFFLYFYGSDFFILPVIAVPSALVLLCWGIFRFSQGRKIAFYQQHLTVAPRYDLQLSKVPTMKSKDFFGKGFPWASKHVARIEEANKIDNEKYLKNSWNVRMGRSLSNTLQRYNFNRLEELVTSPNRLNPFRPLPKLGGTPELHGVGLYEGEEDIIHDADERTGHMEIDGTTGAGKTVLLRLLIAQDVARGQPTIVFDPKNDKDLFEATYAAAKLAGKEDKFIHFNLGYPDISARYSPFSNNSRMTEVATITTSSLPTGGDATSFKEFAWRYINVIQLALASMGEKATYQRILDYSTDIDRLFVKYCEFCLSKNPQEFEKAIFGLDVSDDDKRKDRALEQWDSSAVMWIRRLRMIDKRSSDLVDSNMRSLMSIMDHEKMHFQKLVASLYPLLEKLTTGAIKDILSPDYDDIDDDRPILDWRNVLKGDNIVYCGFDALSDTTVASAVSAAMLADLVSVAGEVYKHGASPGLPSGYDVGIKTANLYLDEGSDLLGKELIPMLNKSRGAGIKITLSTQSSIADAEVKLGSRAHATQALSNFNTRMIFRVRTAETAKSFCDQLGNAVYYQSMTFSGVTDSTTVGNEVDFTSNTQNRTAIKETAMLSVENIINLPRGHAFLMMNGKVYKVRVPYVTVDKDLLPDEIAEIANRMGDKYYSSANWYVDKWYERQYGFTPRPDGFVDDTTDSGRSTQVDDRGSVGSLSQIKALDEIDDGTY